MRPEGCEEVGRLKPRPFECLVQIGIPCRPEFDDIEECLQNRLVLIVAAGRSQRHERLAVLQNNAWRQCVTRSSAWMQLRGTIRIEPEMLSANAHPDAGISDR